jgi:uncharacterized protein involved in cysteine biosynthesis
MLLPLDDRTPLRLEAGASPLAFGRGVRDVGSALFALLHGRQYVGLLRLPVLANAITLLGLLLLAWTFLLPHFDAAFASPWWLFDGLRERHRHAGANLWTCTTWLLLGPPLLDLIAGPWQEPLRLATERRMLGERSPPPRAGLLRLRERARLLLWLLLLWPPALLLVLLPWVGLPLVAALGAAVAAVVWFEPPMAPRGLALRQRLALLWRHRWRSLGVGLALQLAAAVPFVNLLALAPLATVAATAVYLQFDKRVAA